MAKKAKRKRPIKGIKKDEDEGVQVPLENAGGKIEIADTAGDEEMKDEVEVEEEVVEEIEVDKVEESEIGVDENAVDKVEESEIGVDENAVDETEDRKIQEGLMAQLKRLQKELEEKKKDVALQEEEKTALVNDIVSLKKVIQEIARVSESFGNAFASLRMAREDIKYYGKKKSEMVNAAVKDKLSEIEQRIEEVDKAIRDEQAERDRSASAFKDAEEAYGQAKEKRDNLQAEYNSIVTLQQQIEDKLKELADIKKTVEEEEEKKHYANMYFLIDSEKKEAGLGSLLRELVQLFRKLQGSQPPGTSKSTQGTDAVEDSLSGMDPIVETAGRRMKRALVKSWRALSAAVKELREKEREMREVKEQFDKSEKRVLELRKNRRSNILEKLTEIKF